MGRSDEAQETRPAPGEADDEGDAAGGATEPEARARMAGPALHAETGNSGHEAHAGARADAEAGDVDEAAHSSSFSRSVWPRYSVG